MASTDDWVAWLVGELGIAEQPPGSNDTPIGVEFGWNGVAWCCETQSLAALHAFGRRILWTAGVADARDRALRGENGMQWVGRHEPVEVGMPVCFDWKGHGNPADMHIEGVVNPGTQDRFETIGGNVHDSVSRQWRDRTFVMGFIRLPFDQVGLAPAQEDDMFTPDDQALLAKIGNALFDPDNGLQARLARVESTLTPVGSPAANPNAIDKQLKSIRRAVKAGPA